MKVNNSKSRNGGLWNSDVRSINKSQMEGAKSGEERKRQFQQFFDGGW